jgi:hypothetical protein
MQNEIFGFSQAGGIAYRLSANSRKSRRRRPPAHLMRSIGLGDRPDGRRAMNSAGDAAAKIKPASALLQRGVALQGCARPGTILR